MSARPCELPIKNFTQLGFACKIATTMVVIFSRDGLLKMALTYLTSSVKYDVGYRGRFTKAHIKRCMYEFSSDNNGFLHGESIS
ncbi:hypothetical protein M8C21_016751 [Ambrosia artemisiifolia]|uniref:Uncharacterized protein n=1 Tax=Ambrosia artemisiifolia TaxID=4212 RepID=A0AAD5GDF7_AMBAR|nr:hypothetical protein M8C21_016751 [Ambrosia artemisiifolia]